MVALSRKKADIDSMNEIGKILFDDVAIAEKVQELGGRISRDYAGKEPIVVSILKGAVIFTTDLVRSISCPLTVEFIQASSYGMSTNASGNVTLKKDLEADIEGRHVLLVDTIIDTGTTFAYLMKMLSERKPASLNAVVLLDKSCRRLVDVPVMYRGFEIPDAFVVGYGLDFKERYRNLPYIAALEADR
ncbi:MAG TPA: hypoxanthine phosphoribosyltransferase [Nitrospirota bacterium]|nr:hypoxanthine phosphoribosyltransferase [Nitrospirota bacterium]